MQGTRDDATLDAWDGMTEEEFIEYIISHAEEMAEGLTDAEEPAANEAEPGDGGHTSPKGHAAVIPEELAQVFGTDDYQHVEQTVQALAPREARVIRYRFGFGNQQPHTLAETMVEFDLTRERLRQIETKFVYRIQQRNGRRKRLSEYLES